MEDINTSANSDYPNSDYSENYSIEPLKILSINFFNLNIFDESLLKKIIYNNEPIEFINARSFSLAEEIFLHSKSIGLLLFNVDIDSYIECLDFIKLVRKDVGDYAVRMIIVAGELNDEIERELFKNTNVDGFYYKNELNPLRVLSIVKKSLHTYSHYCNLETKVNQGDHKYRALYENSPLSFQSLDSNGMILDVNPMWLKTLGYSRDEVIGKWFGDFVHSDYVEGFKRSFPNFKRWGIITNVEFVLKKKNGDSICISLEGRISYSSKGDMIQTYCVFKDLSSEHQMERQIDVVNNKFTELVNNITTAIWKVDFENGKNFKNAYFSPITDELLGLVPGSINNNWKYFVSFIKPQYFKKIKTHFKEAFSKPKISIVCDYEVIKYNGEEAWFQSQGSCFIENNKPHFFGSIIDITEQKLNLEKVKKSEEDYRRLFERAHDAIVIMTPETEIVLDVNQRACNIYGFSRDEFIGLSILDISRNPAIGKKRILKTLETGVSHQFETSQFRKDGSIIYLEINASVFQYKGEKAILSINRDVTKRKIAEDAMQKSEEKFRLLAENSVECIWTTNSKLQFTYLSASLEKLMGVKPEEWEGTKISEHFCEKEFIKVRSIANNAIKNYKTITNVIFETKMFNKNNEQIDLEITGTILFNKNGKLIGLQGTSRDIKERKKDEKIRNVIYNISNSVNTSNDLENLLENVQKELGTIIDTTNFYVALYEEKTKKFVLPFITDQKITSRSSLFAETLTRFVFTTGTPLLANKKKIEYLYKCNGIISEGPEVFVWLGVPLKIDNKVIGVLAVQSYENKDAYTNLDLKMLEFVSDQISVSINRKQIEQDLYIQNKEYAALNREYKEINNYLRKAKDKAEESDKLKTAFLHNISHEIRTPMNGILGFTNLLNKPGLTGQQQNSYVKIIRSSGKRMLATLNDLMDISKLETDQVNIKLKPTNINFELETLYDFFKSEVDKKGLELKIKNDLPNSYAIIYTDKEKLYATLANLIKNSIKYSHKGCIKFGYVKKGDFIEFFVKDNGIGIPKHRQQAIFERFIQADIDDVKVYEGAGLGLSISKAYVELLGGKMWLESEEGKGSAFYFNLPYSVEESPLENVCDGELEFLKDVKLKSKIKILIVEDEEYADTFLSIVLEGIGKKILHAKNGIDCVNLCRSNMDIDLILMDIKMPGMDGYETTKEIRKFNRNVKIIAQTAYALEGDKEKTLESGCDDYISKPIIADELLDKINKLMKFD